MGMLKKCGHTQGGDALGLIDRQRLRGEIQRDKSVDTRTARPMKRGNCGGCDASGAALIDREQQQWA